MEEYKVSKIRTQWMLNNSADIRIREVKPLLRTKRKFKAQDEIDRSVSELMFKEMQVLFRSAVILQVGTISQNGQSHAQRLEQSL